MSLKLIEEIILTSNQSTVTFSNIPQDGKSLLFRVSARCTDTANNGTLTNITCNNQNLDNSVVNAFDGSFGYDVIFSSLANVAKISNAANTSNLFSNFILEINDYSNSGRKRYLSYGAFLDDVNYSAGYFVGGDIGSSAGEINTITFNTTGNFVTGSTFSIYTLGG